MTARIYKPAKTAMQSGHAKTREWVLDYEPEEPRVVESLKPDLLIMGAHGHTGLKDLIFGTTINSVRHHVRVPLLVVKEEAGK